VAALPTMHGKGAVISPPMRQVLGLDVVGCAREHRHRWFGDVHERAISPLIPPTPPKIRSGFRVIMVLPNCFSSSPGASVRACDLRRLPVAFGPPGNHAV